MSSSTEDASGTSATSGTRRGGGKGRRVAALATLLVVVAGLVWFGWWFIHRNDVTTDDAYIHADIAQIAPRVTGTVAKVFVRDNQQVKAGDTLFTLDPSDYKAALAHARAKLQAAQAAYAASQQDISVTQQTTQAAIANARAALASARAENQQAQADARRYRALYGKHEVSRQRLDQKTTAAKSAAARVDQAKAQLAQARAAPDRIKLKQHRASTEKAKIAEAKANLRQAKLNLAYTKIRAPSAGRIAKKSVVAGSHASAGQSAMALVENHPWVVANYKETQLDRVRAGQPVRIHVDAYPNRVFHGRVESIQPGTGVTFSLLPPQNATGNYVKIVQRVPVKIIFSRPSELHGLDVSPGMSVEPTINVAGTIKPLDRAAIPATETASGS